MKSSNEIKELKARCLENNADYDGSAKIYEQLGDLNNACRIYRRIPDIENALRLIDNTKQREDKQALEWLNSLDKILKTEKPENLKEHLKKEEKKKFNGLVEDVKKSFE